MYPLTISPLLSPIHPYLLVTSITLVTSSQSTFLYSAQEWDHVAFVFPALFNLIYCPLANIHLVLQRFQQFPTILESSLDTLLTLPSTLHELDSPCQLWQVQAPLYCFPSMLTSFKYARMAEKTPSSLTIILLFLNQLSATGCLPGMCINLL